MARSLSRRALKSVDFLSLQQGVGNKALRDLVEQRGFDPPTGSAQHNFSKIESPNIGEKGSKAKTKEENDKNQTQAVFQRSPGFGSKMSSHLSNTRLLWGNDTRVEPNHNKTKSDSKESRKPAESETTEVELLQRAGPRN